MAVGPRVRIPRRGGGDWLLLALVLVASSVAWGADDLPREPGLRAEYRDGRGRVAPRVDLDLAFHWDRRRPDARLVSGPLQVRWTGFLESETSGTYRFFAYGTGHFRVRLNGRTVLIGDASTPQWIDGQAIELDYDQHPLEIEYAADSVPAKLAFYWSGPGFALEPLGQRALLHDPVAGGDTAVVFRRGADLYQALRCGGCHVVSGADPLLRAPALDGLAGHFDRYWLIDWLADSASHLSSDTDRPFRRMPQLGLNRADAGALADYLLGPTEDAETARSAGSQRRDQGDIEAGRELFLSLGCLACHPWDGLGRESLFGGGDLSRVAEKRPPDFFAKWLAAPQALNRDHRMPVFELSDVERASLAAFLSTLRTSEPGREREPTAEVTDAAFEASRRRGQTLFTQQRCDACHRGPAGDVVAGAGTAGQFRSQVLLDRSTSWQDSCCGDPVAGRRPGYRLTASQREALTVYVNELMSDPADKSSQPSGQQLLRQNNCLACHDRHDTPGLADLIPGIVERLASLGPVADQLIPPSLSTIGDKLHRAALHAAIARREPSRRPWLRVRMPRFPLSGDQLDRLTNYLEAVDRIPDRRSAVDTRPVEEPALRLAGARLVTTDGFGCVSCHAIGSVQPERTAPGTRGPALDQVSRWIRRSWFDRLLRHPARIARRLEMPSIQTAVRGVLDDDLPRQRDALWYVLSRADFEPPRPNPVRTVRQPGDESLDRHVSVLTDVVRTQAGSLIKPLLIGFANRHSVLYDVATARLVRWSVGDVAHQRTEGKTWYWEVAGEPLGEYPAAESEWALIVNGKRFEPQRKGQFLTEVDQWRHIPGGLEFQHRLQFSLGPAEPQLLYVRQRWWAWDNPPRRGVQREIRVNGLQAGQTLRLRVAPDSATHDSSPDKTKPFAAWTLDGRVSSDIRIWQTTGGTVDGDGYLIAAPAVEGGEVEPAGVAISLRYASAIPIDHYPLDPPDLVGGTAEPLDVVPGFRVTRLPLDPQIMPTALAWSRQGALLIASLKGRVWRATDQDGDRLEETLSPFSDELAAPYGLAAGEDYLDVLNKSALLRLYDEDGDGRAERTETIASGWGHTDDYHDWAVGLPSDAEGHYFVALPCQQDDREPSAAHLRGRILRLVPQAATPSEPRRFRLTTWATGQRFPMGLARNRQGILVATDNQGNYNPFNELNHILPGRDYGFINRLERDASDRPPLTVPAINIPHPWTRSVNGICFLERPPTDENPPDRSHTVTKDPSDPGADDDLFGPFAGQLVGCEYDTRRLIRMSLQEVNGRWQGAAYPLSRTAPADAPTMRGPTCCAVSPSGDLYVGSLRDSGWGGANNVGEVLRVEFNRSDLPCGIREVVAIHGGWRISFTATVDAALAADPTRYAISSYFRVSTPAYGGDDQDRRNESVSRVSVAPNAMAVDLFLDSFVAGRVYEIRVGRLIQEGEFFPAEAYYTLNELPPP